VCVVVQWYVRMLVRWYDCMLVRWYDGGVGIVYSMYEGTIQWSDDGALVCADHQMMLQLFVKKYRG